MRLATYSTSVKPLSPTAATTHSSSISGNQCIVEAKNNSAEGDDQSVAFRLESSIEKTTEVSQKDQVCLSDPITLDEFTSKKVHRTADLPISRSATVRDLYAQILKLYPHLRDSTVRHSNIVSSVVAEKAEEGEVSSGNSESTAKKSTGDFFDRDVLSIAKGFTTGPPLTLKSSMKLSWDPAIIVNSPDLQIDHPSLGMRDGTLLVVRGDIDWKRYCKQLSGQESSGSVQPENDERTMSPVRAAAVIPPWKSKSILNKKKPMVSQTNTNTEYSSDTNTVVKSAGGTSTSRFSSGGGSTFRSRTVEKGLSLGSSACSRQAHLIQSALDLDSKVNQEEDPGSVVVSTEEFNSDIDCVGGVNNSTTTVHVKRTVDLDSVPPLPNCPSNDLLSYMSITSDTDVNNVDDPSFSGVGVSVGVSVGLMEQRMPIAPVEVIRALKDKDQSHIIDALHL